MKNKMLSGTFWMSFGSIFSRILGVIYIIPWLLMLGSQQNQYTAQALFNAAYTPYALFLALGTSGFPTAISRKIAIYNSEQRFRDSQQLFRAAIFFMCISGLVCGLLFYFAAPAVAGSSPILGGASAVSIIRALVPALFILPVMSIIRGWFQGNEDMKPFGVSQLVEQLVRVLSILLLTFISYTLLHTSLEVAVALSTFAAFTGAIASLAYLMNYYHRQKPLYQKLKAASQPATGLNTKQLFWQICKEALPFVYVGSAITIAQLIDQFTFKQIMRLGSQLSLTAIQNMFTLFSANPSKITTVIVSLAIAISGTTLPLLASAHADPQKAAVIIQDNFRLLFGLLAPVTIILALLAGRINTVFFGYNLHGSWLMFWSILITFVQAIFTDVFTLIQSLGKHRMAVILLSITLLIKFILQYPLVYFFHDYGALWATAISFGLVAEYCVYYLMKLSNETKLADFADLGLLSRANLIFAVLATGLLGILSLFSVADTRIASFLFSCVYGLLALGILAVIAYYYNLPKIILKLKWGRTQYKHF
ncbi:MAG: polysaccharide biosynthesis protein [Liquorilactobacillus ghanensis]|uniref:putative polysaccharide biosynthesis protein n=2 Tax=Liquorilactobacillus ghanensis TaxID=399370 RepID=UPI0039ED6A50